MEVLLRQGVTASCRPFLGLAADDQKTPYRGDNPAQSVASLPGHHPNFRVREMPRRLFL
jgi:hypothetical protein